MEKKKNHTTIRNGKLFCTHCGQSEPLKLPIGITAMIDLMDKFEKRHDKCEPTWKEPEPNMKKTMQERIHFWAENGEHGISSQTIFTRLVMLDFDTKKGVKNMTNSMRETILPYSQWDHPHDPADFYRCYKLLKCVPEWREKEYMDNLSLTSPQWKKLVENWEEMTKILEEELPTGEAVRLHEFMNNLKLEDGKTPTIHV